MRTAGARTARGAWSAALIFLLVAISTGVASAVFEPAAYADPVLAAAGDIACAPGDTNPNHQCQQAETAELIASQHPDAVAPLGDDQYDQGLLTEYDGAGAYNATWGQFNPIAHPVAGNHEYGKESPKAEGFFEYFHSVLPTSALEDGGYYSYQLGAWHIIALNSNCSDLGCGDFEQGVVTTAELDWLKADLAAHTGQCVLAYWHHPAFTSGTSVQDSPGVLPLWEALYAAHADVVLNGHDHLYERYAPQSPSQVATSAGIREFVVGTGGQTLFELGAAQPNLEASDDKRFGVLFLTLHAYSYEWAFRATDGTVLDSGSSACHALPPPSPPPAPSPQPPAPPSKPAPKPAPLKFTVHIGPTVRRAALRRGLTARVYCSLACQVRTTSVLVRRRGHPPRKVRYRLGAVTVEPGHRTLRLKLRLGGRGGARLTFLFTATSATLERRQAAARTRLLP